jgi:GH24 family phage-related lysozyme (muramidase)
MEGDGEADGGKRLNEWVLGSGHTLSKSRQRITNMEQQDRQTPLTDEARKDRDSKLLERFNDPSTTDDERDSIRSFIFNDGLNRLLADEG